MEKYVAADDGRVVIDLERVAEVHVWLVGGDVSIGGTAAPPRLEVECQRGDPVRVADEDGMKMTSIEKKAILRALETTNGNKTKAAELLGIVLPASRPYQTFAGYLLQEFGAIPGVGDKIEAGGWRFEIVAMSSGNQSRVRPFPS